MTVHRSDWLPTGIITFGVALAFVPFFAPLPAWALVALFVVSVAARSIAPVHQHCHAHFKLFRAPALNHAYDQILMLAAGNTTAIWELQHVLGHHRSLLDPANDPAHTCRFTSSGPLQRVIFTIAGDFLSFTDSLAVARRERTGRRLLGRLWTHQAIQLAAIAALVAWQPATAFWFFVLPAVLLRWTVFWFSFSQHHGLAEHATDVYSGSATHFGWTNAIFLNVGHHTAHHEKPTLHWSKLPARTQVILDRIPQVCLR